MTTATHSARVLILGSGPGGLTAAIYAARAGHAPILVQGMAPGGQLTTTTDVENYPGFRDVIQGPWLMEEMSAQAEAVGTQLMYDHIARVDLSERPFRLYGDSGTVYVCDTLIVATGAQARWLGLDSEEALKGKRRVGLCHLRRLLLSRQEGGGDRRRQHGGGGGALPHQSLP